jgi:hypothetical protein
MQSLFSHYVIQIFLSILVCLFNLPIGCENSLIGNMDKDYYFSKDGLGMKQGYYWSKY